ncbi:MAG: hydantoinase/oxoprolinase family protein [Syntrophorhabdales bacterium]
MENISNQYFIYTDTGGTFTDCVVVGPGGEVMLGKASTTPENLEDCFFSSISAALEGGPKSLSDVLKDTRVIGYGTTQGTNVIVTGAGAPNLGFITTKGQEDRTYIMRFRAAGLGPIEGMHLINADKPRFLIPRTSVRGVAERVDCFGKVVCRLDEKEATNMIKELVEDEKVEGIAVGLLWSFLNNKHELRIREIINEMYPELPVALSHEVNPIVREEPRFRTTQIDLYIGKALRVLLDKISKGLKEKGYKYPLLILQAAGGVSRADVVKPANTLHSGPVGGLDGIDFWKKAYGIENVMGSDVGGTSFDITISSKRGPEYLREPKVGRYEISNPMMEIITIGAGGGTVANVDEVIKALVVGPESAGADPGPVCYGKGGVTPTVTDADVVLNRIDPNYFLGGKIKLDRDIAFKAIEERIAKPLGLDVYQAAQGIISIIDAKMGSTLRTTLAGRGLDPSQFILFAFGGAGPTHCAGYAKGINFKEVIVPKTAAVFSAFGASTADIKHRHEGSPFVIISSIPYNPVTSRFRKQDLKMEMIPEQTLERFNSMMEGLERVARIDMEQEGYKEGYDLKYEMLARYGGQLWEIRIQIPVSRLRTVEEFAKLLEAYEDEYERVYTKGAMVPAGGIEIVTVAVEAIKAMPKPQIVSERLGRKNPGKARKGTRDVYWDGKFMSTEVYQWELLGHGNEAKGPAIVESVNTTLVVPPGQRLWVDEYKNVHMPL